MDAKSLAAAVDRAERAIERIERALKSAPANTGQDDRLRARVREAITELDRLIGEHG